MSRVDRPEPWPSPFNEAPTVEEVRQLEREMAEVRALGLYNKTLDVVGYPRSIQGGRWVAQDAVPRESTFSEKMVLFLSVEQSEWLEAEVHRRKRAGETSSSSAAHGGNRNVNKGMLIREAIESHFRISGKPEAA